MICKASLDGSSVGNRKGGKAINSIASGGCDEASAEQTGQSEKIKNYSLALATHIPPKDKEKHRRDATKYKEGADGLHKAIFIQDLDKIALVEERSDTI